MSRLLFCAVLLLVCILVGCAVPRGQDANKPVLESPEMTADITKLTAEFKLGDDKIHVVLHEKQPSTLTMINVHHDESTSVEAGMADLKQHGGRLIEFVHPGGRLIAFRLDGQNYTFDPNRVFSDAGIKATLEKFGPWSPAAQDAVKSFTADYMKHFQFERQPVIVALHNTTDGAFSIKSYLPDGQYGSASVETYVSPHRNKFDFFYVTDKRFYDYLKARDFNVSLQDNKNTPDDGSLSVYFARKGVPYLNIEAEMGHLSSQIEMVQVAREMVEKFFPQLKKS
jgi:hypothetical protein